MKQFLFSLFCLCLTFGACSPGKKNRSSAIKQGIEGWLREETGNRMPMKGAVPAEPRAIQGTIFVYEPTNTSQVARIGASPVYTAVYTKLVASVPADSTGAFRVALPAGSYSLFVQRGKNFYANLFDAENNISLFTVTEGKMTRARITVSSAAAY